MKPERIQFAPKLPTAPESDRGVFQTFRFDSLRKATNFAEFVEDMADNHGRKATCKTHYRTYSVDVLASIDGDAGVEEAALQLNAAWTFLDEVEEVHAIWSAPAQES